MTLAATDLVATHDDIERSAADRLIVTVGLRAPRLTDRPSREVT
jgi:hypothetical protein